MAAVEHWDTIAAALIVTGGAAWGALWAHRTGTRSATTAADADRFASGVTLTLGALSTIAAERDRLAARVVELEHRVEALTVALLDAGLHPPADETSS